MSRPAKYSKYEAKRGFTLVELMLALAFFSFILIFVLGGFLLITRNYNRGVTSARIHQAGRNTLEQMVRELRQSAVDPKLAKVGDQAFICLSSGTYRTNADEDSADRGKLDYVDQDLTEDCSDGNTSLNGRFNGADEQPVLDASEIIVTGIDLQELDSNLSKLTLSLASANITSDLGEDTDGSGDGINDSCSVATSGSEFCDVVTLDTVFSTRN